MLGKLHNTCEEITIPTLALGFSYLTSHLSVDLFPHEVENLEVNISIVVYSHKIESLSCLCLLKNLFTPTLPEVQICLLSYVCTNHRLEAKCKKEEGGLLE